MLTLGVYCILIWGSTFLLIWKWRGVSFAYLALCWVPIVGLIVPYFMRDQLGWDAIAIWMWVAVASLGLVAVGVGLTIRARRIGLRDATWLSVATFFVAIPALIGVIVVWHIVHN